MKTVFSELVEKSRDLSDPRFATKTGESCGLFRVASPVTGGTLRIVVGSGESWREERMSGEPWEHISVSKISSIPSWEEMCFVKDLFFDDEETVIQYHPGKSKYVNQHPNVLHLWRPTETAIPMPPLECV